MSDTMIVVLLGAIASLVAILTPIIKVTSSITEIKAILTHGLRRNIKIIMQNWNTELIYTERKSTS